MEHKKVLAWTRLLFTAFPFLLRDEDGAGSLSSTISLSSIYRTAASAPVSREDNYIYLFLSVVCKIHVPFFSDLQLFIPRFGSAHPAVKNNGDIFVYDVVNGRFVSDHMSTIPSSSSSVTFTRSSCAQTIFRAFVIDSGSVVSTRRKRPLWKQILSSSGYSWQSLYSELSKITSPRLFNIAYDRNRVATSAFRVRLLAVVSAPSRPWGYAHGSKRVFSASVAQNRLIAATLPDRESRQD